GYCMRLLGVYCRLLLAAREGAARDRRAHEPGCRDILAREILMAVEVDTTNDAPCDHIIGEVLATRYRIEERLGEGAMGAVYRAKHVKVGRPFAVKVLHPRLLEDQKQLQRFEREAELAGRLRHPNVIGVVDVGDTGDGMRYMVMDFAEG